jgi:hypothetical protein
VAHTFVVPEGNDVQSRLFLPESGQIVVKIGAPFDAVVNAGCTISRVSGS